MTQPATHAADVDRTGPPPAIADALAVLRTAVRARAHGLRRSAALPPGTRAGVEAWTVSGIDGVEIWMQIPPVYLRDEAAKAYARSVSEQARELFAEFTALLAEHQPASGPQYRAFVSISFAGRLLFRTGL